MAYLTPEQIAAAQGMFTPTQPPAQNMSLASMPLDAGAPLGPPPVDAGASYMPAGAPPPAPMPDYGPPPEMNPQLVSDARSMFSAPEPNMSRMPPAPPPEAQVEVGPSEPTPGSMGHAFIPYRPQEEPAPAPAPVARPSGGGGMGGLQAAATRDRAAMMSTYDASKDAQNAEGRALASKGIGVADILDAQARLQEEHAAISREEVRQAQDKHAEYMAGTQKLVDEVASKKIDPNRIFHSGEAGRDITVAIGAMLIAGLGGFAQASTGRNPGLEALNTMIDRDIATQEKNIAGARTAIAARQSIYGQMREQLGDKMLADDRFRIAAIEAAKNRLLAFSAGADSKVDVARSNAALAVLDREQKKLQSSFSDRAVEVAKAQAGAQAAAQARSAQQQFDNLLKVRELQIKEGEAANKANGGKQAGATDLDKQRAEYAQQLEKGGLPRAVEQINAIKANLPQPGKPIPGLDLPSRLKVGAANLATFGLGGDVAEGAVLPKDALLNRKNLDALGLAYQNALTGAGASDKEQARISKAFMGARTPEEMWDTIAQADAIIQARKANLEAGYGPEVVQSYNANMQGSSRPPLSSFKPGLK